MPTDQPPIPREALPPGWCPTERCDGRFAYRHSQPPVEVIADRTAADRSHPTLGLGSCWELHCRYFLGDRSITDLVGRVSTREAAVDGLLECMHRIHDRVDESSDQVDVLSVLEELSFSDIVPDRQSS